MFAYLILFVDGSLERSHVNFRTYSGAAGAMRARLTRIRPERAALLEATAIIPADAIPPGIRPATAVTR